MWRSVIIFLSYVNKESYQVVMIFKTGSQKLGHMYLIDHNAQNKSFERTENSIQLSIRWYLTPTTAH